MNNSKNSTTFRMNDMLTQLQSMVSKLQNEPNLKMTQNMMIMNMQMNFMNMIHMLKDSNAPLSGPMSDQIENVKNVFESYSHGKTNGENFLKEMSNLSIKNGKTCMPTKDLSSPANLQNLHSEIDTTTRLIEKLDLEMNVNQPELILPKNARFFIIKSFTEEDVHRAVKYKIWCSTKKGNSRLNNAWEQVKKRHNNQGEVYLFFSVNASGHFCGVAKMKSPVDLSANTADIWSRDDHNAGGLASKWTGKFDIEWVYIKDVPNNQFRHLAVPSNSYKPFPHSRDTQEIDISNARAALKIFHMYNHRTSLLDDFDFYNKLEERQKKIDQKFIKLNNGYKTYPDKNGLIFNPGMPIKPEMKPFIIKTPSKISPGSKNSMNRAPSSSSSQRPSITLCNDPNYYYQSPVIISSGTSKSSSGDSYSYENEEIPGVLQMMRKSSVKQILNANKRSKMQICEILNDEIEEYEKRGVRKPGPNAIPIVKPRD